MRRRGAASGSGADDARERLRAFARFGVGARVWRTSPVTWWISVTNASGLSVG